MPRRLREVFSRGRTTSLASIINTGCHSPAGSQTWLRRRLLRWYDHAARDLPWRGAGRTPYRVLVSEAMLQQTQVATVLPYFQRFTAALPTIESLASADEQTVLRLWQGLGYYSRARRLHGAAKAIVSRHAGQVPQTVEDLLTLPGVGRYTAGAVASIAYDVPAPIVDGNVTRVLCRLDCVQEDPGSPPTQQRLWQRAAELVPGRRAGDFNSALMELGATVCTPRNPQCLVCPLRESCKARSSGLQAQIPRARRRQPTPLVERDVFAIRNSSGAYLVEQRPTTGRWAGMWQFITRSRGSVPPVEPVELSEVALVRHALTHRRYLFRVLAGESDVPAPHQMQWTSPAELDELPMSRPQLRVRVIITDLCAQQSAAK